jgi:hypothetical protein
MTKLDRGTRFDRYEAVLTEHGCQELLSSVEALMRELAARFGRRKALRDRGQRVMRSPSRALAAAQRRRSPDGLGAGTAEDAQRLGADHGGSGKARPAKRNRAIRTGKAT